MKCPILTANKYQRGFNADLLFTGFRGKAIFWKGNDLEKLKKVKENNDKLMDDELATEAGLTWCGSDNEGNDEYIGTNKEWNEYERLESLDKDELLNDKLMVEYQDNMLDDELDLI